MIISNCCFSIFNSTTDLSLWIFFLKTFPLWGISTSFYNARKQYGGCMLLRVFYSLSTASQIFTLETAWQTLSKELQYTNPNGWILQENDHMLWPQLLYIKKSAPLMLDHIKWERILRPHIWPLSEPDYPETVARDGLCINFFGRKSTYWTLYHAKNHTPLLGVVEAASSSLVTQTISSVHNWC